MILTVILIASYVIGSGLTWLALKRILTLAADAGQKQELEVLGAASIDRTCAVIAAFWPMFWASFTAFLIVKGLIGVYDE